MGSPTGGRCQYAFSSGALIGELKPVFDDTTHTAMWDGIAEVGRTIEAQGTHKTGAVKPEKLIAISYAPCMFFHKPCCFELDGVSVFLELVDGLLGVVDFENSIYFADWCLLL